MSSAIDAQLPTFDQSGNSQRVLASAYSSETRAAGSLLPRPPMLRSVDFALCHIGIELLRYREVRLIDGLRESERMSIFHVFKVNCMPMNPACSSSLDRTFDTCLMAHPKMISETKRRTLQYCPTELRAKPPTEMAQASIQAL